jgi:hypothetical protein
MFSRTTMPVEFSISIPAVESVAGLRSTVTSSGAGLAVCRRRSVTSAPRYEG